MTQKRHILTVSLEDYYQVRSLSHVVDRHLWYRFENRLEKNTLRALDLLDQYQAKATFFVLGCVADRQPEVLREVVRRGHEIGNKGYYPRTAREGFTDELRDDLRRSRDTIEQVTGVEVVGCRIPQLRITPSDLQPLDRLANEGYAYDSSMVPLLGSFRSQDWRRFVHQHHFEDKTLWEVPISCSKMLGWNLPIGGGNYFRQFPHSMMKRLVEQWDNTEDAPFVMYFNIWELDQDLPTISAASTITRLRQYRNIDKMTGILREYLEAFRFTGIAEHLGITAAARTAVVEASPAPAQITASPVPNRLPVSIVVPVFNEQSTLQYLANTLRSVEASLADRYELEFVFVEDGSADRSWESLVQLFGGAANCTLRRHGRNQGVGAAILTGIQAARNEVVATMDCDCTYDPHELKNMLPLLTADIDMVTASPYSPQGRVLRVPAWRLALSKTASWLYGLVLRQKLHTYTSCFRVCRKSAISGMHLTHQGFLGVAEMLGRLDLQGSRIVEYPTTLEVRLLGVSKMKVLRTIGGHVCLLVHLLSMRFLNRSQARLLSPRIARTTNEIM